MLYLLRHKDGSLDPASSGTLVDPQGQARHLNLADFTSQGHGGLEIAPLRGHLPVRLADQLPGAGLQPHAATHPGRPGTARRHELRPGDLLGRPGEDPGDQARASPSPAWATSNSPATPAPWAGGFKKEIWGRGLRGSGPLPPPPRPHPQSREFVRIIGSGWTSLAWATLCGLGAGVGAGQGPQVPGPPPTKTETDGHQAAPSYLYMNPPLTG